MPREEYNNGYYVGAMSDGKRHGIGTYYWNSGNRYSGNWDNGDMHGNGIYFYKDGCCYIGDFVRDKRQGHGIFYYPSGAYYDGDYIGDKRSGRGVYHYADGDAYVGDFLDGNFHGTGTYYWNNGDWYEGDWANDERNGVGIYHYSDGSWVHGNYADSKLVSSIATSDGSRPSPQANNKQQPAETAETDESEHVSIEVVEGKYEGTVDDDGQPDGEGELDYINGDMYVGQFRHGLRHGVGTLVVPQQTMYIGMFVDGDRSGVGRWENIDGDWYYGQWKDDKRNGFGVAYMRDFGYTLGRWQDDVCETETEFFADLGEERSWKSSNMGKVLVGDKQSGNYLIADTEQSVLWWNKQINWLARFDKEEGTMLCGYLGANKRLMDHNGAKVAVDKFVSVGHIVNDVFDGEVVKTVLVPDGDDYNGYEVLEEYRNGTLLGGRLVADAQGNKI